MGIDIRHEISIAFLKSIQWFIINLWYLGIILVVVIGVQIYLAKKYKITTVDDFVYFVLARIEKDKNPPILYLTKDTFPKDFVWLTPVKFLFGKYGSISFRNGDNNNNRNAFQLLTEAKGGEVRVQKTANLLNINANQTRVTMHDLSQRLQNDPNVAPFIDVITTHNGGYKLAIKADILKQ